MTESRACTDLMPFPNHRTLAEVMETISAPREYCGKHWNRMDTEFAIARWGQGLTHRAIAKLLGISRDRVASLIARLRKADDPRILLADESRLSAPPRQLRTSEFPSRALTAAEREAALAEALKRCGGSFA